MSGISSKNETAIVGVGYTPIERRSGRTLGDMATEAALNAIEDAGLSREDIDGYVGSPNAQNASAQHADGLDEISSHFMVAALGLQNATWIMDVQGMATGMVVAATQALISGSCRYVVAVRALYNPLDRKYSVSSSTDAAGVDQFIAPYGIGPGGGRFAQWLQRYMHDHGASGDELFEIARVARAHARYNPAAVWRNEDSLTFEKYRDARWICAPMCLYDSDMPVTAAGAVVLTTADRARDLHHRPAYIAGYANGTRLQRVFGIAGINPSGMQVAQIYDGYSPMVWNWLEKLGFCAEGEAHAFTQGGRIELGGALPLNTFGGTLGEGRLHGMGHLREAAMQAMGRAGERQVPQVDHSLVQVGVPERSWTLVLSTHAQR